MPESGGVPVQRVGACRLNVPRWRDRGGAPVNGASVVDARASHPAKEDLRYMLGMGGGIGVGVRIQVVLVDVADPDATRSLRRDEVGLPR